MVIETVKIQKRYMRKDIQAARIEGQEIATYLGADGKKLEALLGEIKKNREQRKQWAAKRELTRRRKVDMECHSCHQKGQFVRECPTLVRRGKRCSH